MFKARLSSLLFALFASASLAVSAAEISPKPASQAEEVQVAAVAQVDLNSADVATLQRELLGIGQVRAEAIVAYREEHGKFASVDELLEVKGIGASIMERNRDRLSVN
nr:helix-hairpin-helix domain-containing protein [uncultured Pseudomonas sp.]